MADWVKVMLVPATLAFSALWAADSRESLTELEAGSVS